MSGELCQNSPGRRKYTLRGSVRPSVTLVNQQISAQKCLEYQDRLTDNGLKALVTLPGGRWARGAARIRGRNFGTKPYCTSLRGTIFKEALLTHLNRYTPEIAHSCSPCTKGSEFTIPDKMHPGVISYKRCSQSLFAPKICSNDLRPALRNTSKPIYIC